MDIFSCIALLTMAAVVFGVFKIRKRREYRYSLLDYSCIILNTVLILFVYPPLTAAGALLGYERYATEPLSIFLEGTAIALGALVPAVSVAGIGASIILRRKEKPGWSFLVQFAGVVWFAVTLAVAYFSGSY